MFVPYLKIAGGAALFWISLKLLAPGEPKSLAPDKGSGKTPAESVFRAVTVIAIADIVMSLDNVIAVAAAAKGNFALLIFGLGFSIPIIIAGATVFMAIVSYFPLIIWAGAAVLGWLAGDLIATDPVVIDGARAFGPTAAPRRCTAARPAAEAADKSRDKPHPSIRCPDGWGFGTIGRTRPPAEEHVVQFGRSYEEFEVGATYKHWPGKTVTEYDDHLFCLLTMNHHPLHLDTQLRRGDHAVRQERRGRQLRLLDPARHERPRHLGQGDRQPRDRVAAPRRADVPRRHALRRDHRARQVGVEVARTTGASSTSRRSATTRTARSCASSAAR